MASLLRRMLGGTDPAREALRPLYDAIVAQGRAPWWYATGGAPDTLDGRFDMITAVLALVLMRIEAEGEAGRAPAALLTELFVDDMDGQLRQAGVGDIVVGKHVGRMMGALGGRIAAYREGLATGDLVPALERNLWRGDPPPGAQPDAVAARLRDWWTALGATPGEAVLAGRLPA